MSAFAKSYFSWGFTVWNVGCILVATYLILRFIPARQRAGQPNALGYLVTCSLIGSLSVVEIQAIATAVVSAAAGGSTAPWTNWLWWAVMGKAAFGLVLQLYYLNEALAR